uniref:RING-type domain-containing protein n=1 Tax=Acrobeloides nanus TaxID=290746 RepID=A0A914C751_9BILA
MNTVSDLRKYYGNDVHQIMQNLSIVTGKPLSTYNHNINYPSTNNLSSLSPEEKLRLKLQNRLQSTTVSNPNPSVDPTIRTPATFLTPPSETPRQPPLSTSRVQTRFRQDPLPTMAQRMFLLVYKFLIDAINRSLESINTEYFPAPQTTLLPTFQPIQQPDQFEIAVARLQAKLGNASNNHQEHPIIHQSPHPANRTQTLEALKQRHEALKQAQSSQIFEPLNLPESSQTPKLSNPSQLNKPPIKPRPRAKSHARVQEIEKQEPKQNVGPNDLRKKIFEELAHVKQQIEEKEKEDENNTCCICLERFDSVRICLYPCGHTRFCKLCANNIKICSLCRTEIQSKQMIYV